MRGPFRDDTFLATRNQVRVHVPSWLKGLRSCLFNEGDLNSGLPEGGRVRVEQNQFNTAIDRAPQGRR